MLQRIREQMRSKAVRASIMLSMLMAAAMPFAFAAEGDPVTASGLLSDAGTQLATEMKLVIVAAFGAFLGVFVLKISLRGGINFISGLFGRR